MVHNELIFVEFFRSLYVDCTVNARIMDCPDYYYTHVFLLLELRCAKLLPLVQHDFLRAKERFFRYVSVGV